MNHKEETKKQKIQVLELIRAFAALLVVMDHASLFSERNFSGGIFPGIFADGGGVGVQTFFVLSGFIHFYVHHKDFFHPEKIKLFVYKRVVRIYPLYWIISLPLIPIYFIFPYLGNKSADASIVYVIKSLLLIPQEENPLLSVGWTLSVELLFYTFMGILIFFKPKTARTILLLVLLGTLFKFFGDMEGGWDTKYRTGNSLLDYNFIMAFIFIRYNLAFAMGGLGAFILLRYKLIDLALKEKKYQTINVFILLISTILVFLPPNILGSIFTSQTNRILYYGPIVAILIVSSVILEKVSFLKIPSFVAYWGNASYSIFLVHYPVIIFLGTMIVKLHLDKMSNYKSLMYLSTVFSILCGVTIYEKIEKPILVFFQTKQSQFFKSI